MERIFCTVCGTKLKEFGEKLESFDAETGELVYRVSFRCSKNPCHQGHIEVSEKVGLLQSVMDFLLCPFTGIRLICAICGRKRIWKPSDY